jgi:hypothetical protein
MGQAARKAPHAAHCRTGTINVVEHIVKMFFYENRGLRVCWSLQQKRRMIGPRKTIA